MTDTSSSLPICIYCGTPRPADETRCPNCGKPWIDITVDKPTTPAAPAAVAAGAATRAATPPPAAPPPPDSPPPDATSEFGFDDWTPPPEPKGGKAKWLIPLVLMIAVGALWAFVFVDRGTTSATTTVVASDTTTSVATTTTQQTETTTTQAETTTTTSSTTTTVPYPAAESWLASGDPIPLRELGLKASGIGPITLGAPIAEAAGALVASLGSAETASLDSTMCADSEWYSLIWGDLRGIFDGYDGNATLVAYRYETDGQGTTVPLLETLSGIALGDSVETLQRTYGSYTVSFEVIEGKDHFRLSDGGELLLWGPLSSTEPQGVVEGIYSPDPCPSEN